MLDGITLVKKLAVEVIECLLHKHYTQIKYMYFLSSNYYFFINNFLDAHFFFSGILKCENRYDQLYL